MYPQRERQDTGRDAEQDRMTEIERELGRILASTTCLCGDPIVVQPSWKPKNSGRRFLGCKNWRAPDGGCGYFYWFDPPMCLRSKQIIPGLLRKKNALEAKYKIVLYSSWALFAVVIGLVIVVKFRVGC